MPRPETKTGVRISNETLSQIQQALFDRAAALREESTVRIDSLDEFEQYFAEGTAGGLAYCHFVDGPEMETRDT